MLSFDNPAVWHQPLTDRMTRFVPLQALEIPLADGIKHLPVRFTPTARIGARP